MANGRGQTQCSVDELTDMIKLRTVKERVVAGFADVGNTTWGMRTERRIGETSTKHGSPEVNTIEAEPSTKTRE